MQNLKSRFLLGGVAFLLIGASCSDSKEDSKDSPDAGANNGADASPNDPDADTGNALPACAGASESYLMAVESEVVDFGGPNISVILADDEVALMFPTTAEYGTGSWTLPDQSEWTVEFCVNWNGDNCDSQLVPLEGELQIDTLQEGQDVQTTFTGSLVSAIFVDDASMPTCQALVDVAFSDNP